MNVIHLLSEELKDKDWDLLTKARYLYIRSCCLFTYDPRYTFLEKEEGTEILNRKINLENVTDNRVTCRSWASEVFIPLLELIGIKGEIQSLGTFHEYVIFPISSKIYKADATLSSDLSRVKMNNTTREFSPIDKNEDFSSQLFSIDKKIGYISSEYSSEKINRFHQEFAKKYENKLEITEPNPELNDEILLYKLFKIKELLESWPALKDYYDYNFCNTYLRTKILTREERRKTPCIELYNPKKINWDFKQIILIRLNEKRRFLCLENNGNSYQYHEISKDEAKRLAKERNYIGPNKGLLRF